ncbi:phosphoribosylamine--glycine ligase [Phenylobacterium sp. J426]|uniref:phosphoribosylamine--glycine ligase n=1 Tax=Phenylobacterium sp. J426 TaxID=2898439 RepID=UPI0021512962|nr:phosphoribosylamine--glycine ligase [Phenylobacterium sp. J426]MCR5873370.1 phosphoribosylamine--glycine ligase [Phenylobacterium sp. J426]
MNILLVGSGGREHALAWKIAASPLVTRLVAAPGNPGMAAQAELRAVSATDVDGLVALAREIAADLVVIGPESAVDAGLGDALEAAGIPCFGPSAAAGQLESSKAFTKAFCDRHGLPTSAYAVCESADEAKAALDRFEAPYVIKADGLAAGKGVVIAHERAEAEAAIDDAFGGRFGAAGARVVLEEFLDGEIGSLFALCDGETSMLFGWAQDHKRAFDGEQGPNTGGMGAYSPAPVFTPELVEQIRTRLVEPAFAGIAADGSPYRGVLFVELMATRTGPKLVEFNVRFGDPECQVLMLRLESDLVPYLQACAKGTLHEMPAPKWRDEPAVCVVLAAKGYPGTPVAGGVIRGLDSDLAEAAVVFHAGTRREADGSLRAAGGRVLNVCARGPDLKTALDRAYAAVDKIDFPDGFCRRDIGWRALAR